MKKQTILIVLIVLALPFVLFYSRMSDKKTERPSPQAPQLNTENPGDQSAFITAPGESEIG